MRPRVGLGLVWVLLEGAAAYAPPVGRWSRPSVVRPDRGVRRCVRCLSQSAQKKSNLGQEESMSTTEWPAPAVGDVVAFAGDWPGESSVGLIRSLQFRRETWVADVVPLEDQAGGVWRSPSSGKARATRRAVEVSELVPLDASYVSEVDGYEVARNKDETEQEDDTPRPLSGTAIGLRRLAEGYETPSPDFVPRGGTPRLTYDDEQMALVEYEALKSRLALDAAISGAAGTALVAAVTGAVADAAAFFLGAAASLAYVLLLGRATDAITSGDDDRLSRNRFAPIALAFAVLAGKHYLDDPAAVKPFSVVPTREFALAAAGVLSYRVPLVLRGLAVPGLADQAAELLPGSLGVAARRAVAENQERERRDDESASVSGSTSATWSRTVLVICGPPGVGKTALAQRLVAADPRFATPGWTLVSPKSDPETYDDRPRRDVLGADELDALAPEALPVRIDIREDDEPVSSSSPLPSAQGAFDAAYGDAPEIPQAQWALRRDELLARPDGKVPVLDCDVNTARQLEGLAGARLVGVWVSLDSLEALEDRLARAEADRARARLPEDASDDDKKALAKLVSDTVQARLCTVVDDIDFGITSPIFEFTIINDQSLDLAFDKLQRAASYVFLD